MILEALALLGAISSLSSPEQSSNGGYAIRHELSDDTKRFIQIQREKKRKEMDNRKDVIDEKS